MTDPEPNRDPVLAQRARAARLAGLGQRIGYLLFAGAIVAFGVGLFVDVTSTIATVVVAALLAGWVVLAPAIFAGFAVKAAVREVLEHGRDPGGASGSG